MKAGIAVARLAGRVVRGGWLGALLSVVVLAGGSPALAQVELIFYGHELSIIGDKRVYLPHALMGLKGAPSDGGAPVDDYYEFQPARLPILPIARNIKGSLITGHGAPDSNLYFEQPISDATYRKIEALIAYWRSPAGSTYNLFHRNCVDFVAEVAKTAGLDVPEGFNTKPAKFLAELKRRNAEPAVAAPTQVAAQGALATAGGSH